MATINEPFASDNGYIFPIAFYTTTTGSSDLEEMVSDYLEDKPISADKLVDLYEDSKSWSTMARLYLIPILVLLTRYQQDRPMTAWIKR